MAKQVLTWLPPKTAPKSFRTDFMRLIAKIGKGKLVWLRDWDDQITLTVARTRKMGDEVVLSAPRFWPLAAPCILNEDGTVNGIEIAKQWIAENEEDQTLMYVKNSDVYRNMADR
jgi:hypothetical protein